MVYSLLHALAMILIILIPSAPFDFQDVMFIGLCANVCKLVFQTHRGCAESCHNVFARVYYESHCFLFHILGIKCTNIYG